MAYVARLLSRLAQLGRVSYDLAVEDDAGLLPPYRHAVSLPLAQDLPAVRQAIRNAAENRAAQEQSQGSRRQRLLDMRDAIVQARAGLLDQVAALQALLDGGGPY